MLKTLCTIPMTCYTQVIPLPGTDYLLVTDGYGSSYVHVLNKTTGAYIPGMTFGGSPTFVRKPFETPCICVRACVYVCMPV